MFNSYYFIIKQIKKNYLFMKRFWWFIFVLVGVLQRSDLNFIENKWALFVACSKKDDNYQFDFDTRTWGGY